jgi:hypothetical protein
LAGVRICQWVGGEEHNHLRIHLMDWFRLLNTQGKTACRATEAMREGSSMEKRLKKYHFLSSPQYEYTHKRKTDLAVEPAILYRSPCRSHHTHFHQPTFNTRYCGDSVSEMRYVLLERLLCFTILLIRAFLLLNGPPLRIQGHKSR